MCPEITSYAQQLREARAQGVLGVPAVREQIAAAAAARVEASLVAFISELRAGRIPADARFRAHVDVQDLCHQLGHHHHAWPPELGPTEAVVAEMIRTRLGLAARLPADHERCIEVTETKDG